MAKVPRCMLLFENACKSERTFVTYKGHLARFLDWCHKDYESLLLLPQRELEELLQDYVIHLKKRVKLGDFNPNSFPTTFNGLFKFLKVGRKNIDKEIIVELFPEYVKCGGDKAISTKQIQIMLNVCKNKRDKALVHLFSAIGARPEALCFLQLKHVTEWREDFLRIVLYANDRHEMVTYLNPEASGILKEYFEWRKEQGEHLTNESYVIRSLEYTIATTKPSPMPLLSLESIMIRLWKESKIPRVKIGKRFDLALTTSFRKRFDTILEFTADVPMGAVQYLMDHAGYMSGIHYRRPTDEQVFNAVKLATPDLMISEEWRLKQEIEQNKQEESDKDRRIRMLEERLANTEKYLMEISKRLS